MCLLFSFPQAAKSTCESTDTRAAGSSTLLTPLSFFIFQGAGPGLPMSGSTLFWGGEPRLRPKVCRRVYQPRSSPRSSGSLRESDRTIFFCRHLVEAVGKPGNVCHSPRPKIVGGRSSYSGGAACYSAKIQHAAFGLSTVDALILPQPDMSLAKYCAKNSCVTEFSMLRKLRVLAKPRPLAFLRKITDQGFVL